MRIKEGYELRQVGDEYVVITIGDAVQSFNGMIRLNETGAYIWKKLHEEIDMEKLTDTLAVEYSVDKVTAERDIKSFIEGLEQTSCFTD